MRLLALETATVEVGVALAGEEGLLALGTLRPGRRHAETLHPLLAEVAARAGTPLAGLDALAVDVGPGLFTGLRVGLAAAKGIAFALGLPVVAATSTEILLHAVRFHPGPVAAVVDMRRGELAWAFAAPGAPAAPLPRLGSPEALAAELASREGPTLLVGDGAARLGARLCELVRAAGGPPPRLGGDELGAPPVAALATLGLARLAAGAALDALAVAPCYLREADARIGWTTRHDDPGVGQPAAAGGRA